MIRAVRDPAILMFPQDRRPAVHHSVRLPRSLPAAFAEHEARALTLRQAMSIRDRHPPGLGECKPRIPALDEAAAQAGNVHHILIVPYPHSARDQGNSHALRAIGVRIPYPHILIVEELTL